MRIKDLKVGDKVRCFGSTGAYLVEVENVVVDMTHYRDIAYVVNANNVKGTLTDNDEWIFYTDKVSNKKHIAFDKENTEKAVKLLSNDVQQKKRFEHLKGNLSRLDGLSSKEKLHWNAKGNIETEDGIEISIVETLLKDEDLQTYVTNEILRQRDNKKNSGVINSQSIETIGHNEDVVNQPNHYTYSNIQVIDYCDQVCKEYPADLSPYVFNVIKYISRSEFKNGKEDCEKAKFYLERIIEKWDEAHE